MTNNWTDIGNSTFVLVMGANPSENHPACMAHINRALNGGYQWVDGSGNGPTKTSSKGKGSLWVIDPRKTRTAVIAEATGGRYIRIRPGTDIAFINGVVRYVMTNMDASANFAGAHITAWKAHMNQSSALSVINDQGTSSSIASRSKYHDARTLVNATTNDDYDRDLALDASGKSVSNLPKVAATYGAANTVYTRLKAHVDPYTTAEVAKICGCTETDVELVAKKFVENSRCASIDGSGNFTGDPTSANHRATTMLYAMGLTQHTCGSQNVKAFAVIQDLMGNIGRSGGGINALRGIHNVQGSTDMGVLYHLIPGYSGNPSLQWKNEDEQAFGKYMDNLYGHRLSGTRYARIDASGADYSGNLVFVARAAGGALAGGTSRFSIEIEDTSGNVVAATTTSVNGTAIKVRPRTGGGNAIVATASEVKTSVDASGSKLVGVAFLGDGSGVVLPKSATVLTGGRGADYAKETINGADTSGNLIFTAKTAGKIGNSIDVVITDTSGNVSAALGVTVSDYTITIAPATDGSGNMTSTANAVQTKIAGTTAANALVYVGVEGDGTSRVGTHPAGTTLLGGIDCTYDYDGCGNNKGPNAYTPDSAGNVLNGMGLQQNGFYHMTRKWFGDHTYGADASGDGGPARRADMDRLYSLWPKVNGTNHVQMFRNMADTGTVTDQVYNFYDASSNPVDTAIISPSTTAVKKGIKAGSVVVKHITAATTYEEGKDYRVNYPGTTFTRIKGGAILPGVQVRISYTYGIRAVVCWGQNPAVTEPNQSKIRAGLKNLDLLVCVDMFANETAMCDRKSDGRTYLIPACSYVEEAGSATNSGRTLQWRYQAMAPKGNSRTDLELLIRFAKALAGANAFSHINRTWANLSTPMDHSGNAFWTKMWKNQYDPSANCLDANGGVTDCDKLAENVYIEMCDRVDKPRGGTQWLYTRGWDALATDAQPAGYTDTWSVQNRAKSRNTSDYWGVLTYPRWGYSWLVNRRVLYNNGDVWRAGAPTDVSGNKLGADEGDSFQGPENCARLFVSNNKSTIDYGTGKYRTVHTMADVPKLPGGTMPTGATLAGRFPWHTEPYESPSPALAATYGYNSTGTALNCIITTTDIGTVAAYPLVLTTIRCVEHFQGGPITRNNPANIEAEPYPWVEINSLDALNLGIGDGDWVAVVTKRTDASGNILDACGNQFANPFPDTLYTKGFKARVGVGAQSNQRVGQGVVAIPWHWGEQGLSTGSRANDVTIDAWDANTTIPEYKACLCKLVKL